MLRDLQRSDWLRILDLSADRIPRALVLRGTRNLKFNYDRYRKHFCNVLDIGTPNGLLEDVLIGEFDGAPVAYASVYGAAMASEVTHLFGVLGTQLVLQTGCCGAWKIGVHAGDLFIPTLAGCGEGAAQYYVGSKLSVAPSVSQETVAAAVRGAALPVHFGRIYSTAALFAEGAEDMIKWAAEGWEGIDMETASTLAVAEHFGMDSGALLFVFDNPRDHGDIIHSEAAMHAQRMRGDAAVIDGTFEIIRRYLALQCNS